MKMPNASARGFVLFSALCIALAFIVIILPLISWSVFEFSLTARSFLSLKALNLADAGAELAIWEIVYNNAAFTAWSGTEPKILIILSFMDNLGERVGDIKIQADTIGPNTYLVTSIGYIPSMSSPTVRKTVKVKVFPHPLFNNAIFGYNSVALTGNVVVDSYDSTVGPYSPISARANGDVGSNGSLSFAENSMVKGDAFVGPAGSVTGNTPVHMTGDTYYWGNDVEQDIITLPDYFEGLPNLGSFSVAGKDNETIPSGTYIYNSISTAAQSTLTINSNTNIYVVSSFSISGMSTVFANGAVNIYIGGTGNFAGQGIVNTTGNPSDLQIYGLGTGTTLSYTGLSNFAGLIHAPQSTIYLGGNAAFFGAVVGNNVNLVGNVQFHYDESLGENGPFSGYDIAYWQED